MIFPSGNRPSCIACTKCGCSYALKRFIAQYLGVLEGVGLRGKDSDKFPATSALLISGPLTVTTNYDYDDDDYY